MPEHPHKDQDFRPSSSQACSAEAAKVIERTLAADHQFWLDVINGEVERLRFNGGYEPMAIDLYQATTLSSSSKSGKGGPAFMGKTRVGHVHFRVEGKWQYDERGNQILRLTILKELQ